MTREEIRARLRDLAGVARNVTDNLAPLAKSGGRPDFAAAIATAVHAEATVLGALAALDAHA